MLLLYIFPELSSLSFLEILDGVVESEVLCREKGDRDRGERGEARGDEDPTRARGETDRGDGMWNSLLSFADELGAADSEGCIVGFFLDHMLFNEQTGESQL
tara:strand:+ start:186 stop:491 length:306 start_codon:yes stop_codon:yes gene_type:complete